jgi:hypothetical protein
LTTSLEAACKQARNLWYGAKGKRAGLVFAVASLPAKGLNLEKLFSRDLSEVTADLIWYWYDSSFDKKYKAIDRKYYYPGFAVVMKVLS